MQKENNEPVKFYRKNQEWGVFSNFYPSPMEQNGINYSTNEHYFQSKKFQGKPYELEIAKAPKPNVAFKMGQSRQLPIRQDWVEVKQKVMYQGLKLKYSQNPDLKAKLLSTGDRQLIEHTNNDHYWGDGLGKGRNRLGILLMQLRDQFRKQQKN